MTVEEIKEAVKTFLINDHTGALLIEGPWGCGKTHFVSKDLIPEIKTWSRPSTSDATDSIYQNLMGVLKKTPFSPDKYYPIMVSLFGCKNVKDIEYAIMDIWTEEITGLNSSKLSMLKDYGSKIVKKIFNSSDKLKGYFDPSKFFEYRLPISLLPANVVIFLDDLERISPEISINEILGFINNNSSVKI